MESKPRVTKEEFLEAEAVIDQFKDQLLPAILMMLLADPQKYDMDDKWLKIENILIDDVFIRETEINVRGSVRHWAHYEYFVLSLKNDIGY